MIAKKEKKKKTALSYIAAATAFSNGRESIVCSLLKVALRSGNT